MMIISSFQDTRNLRTLIAYMFVVFVMFYVVITRSKLLFFVAMLTLVPLVPALNILFWVGTLLAERLLYFPSVGICLGAGYIVAVPFAKLFSAEHKTHSSQSVETTCENKEHYVFLSFSQVFIVFFIFFIRFFIGFL